MDVIIDDRFSGMYCIKLFRFLGAWICVTIARKFFSDDYVDSVIVNGGRPKRLTNMVWLYFAIVACFEIFVITLIALLTQIKIKKDGKDKPIFQVFSQIDFTLGFAADSIGTIALSIGLSLVAAHVLGNRTRFDYVTQGTRASRTLEEMMINLIAISYLVPFFLIV